MSLLSPFKQHHISSTVGGAWSNCVCKLARLRLSELNSPLLLMAFESDNINSTQMDGRKFSEYWHNACLSVPSLVNEVLASTIIWGRKGKTSVENIF